MRIPFRASSRRLTDWSEGGDAATLTFSNILEVLIASHSFIRLAIYMESSATDSYYIPYI